jgi:hypothetical protein
MLVASASPPVQRQPARACARQKHLIGDRPTALVGITQTQPGRFPHPASVTSRVIAECSDRHALGSLGDGDNLIGCDMNEFSLCATSPFSTQCHPSRCSDQRRWSLSMPLPQLSSITFTVWPLAVLSLIAFFMAPSIIRQLESRAEIKLSKLNKDCQ